MMCIYNCGLAGELMAGMLMSAGEDGTIKWCDLHLLVRIHFIIVMIGWTGLAPWEVEFPFPGSLTSTFLWQAS